MRFIVRRLASMSSPPGRRSRSTSSSRELMPGNAGAGDDGRYPESPPVGAKALELQFGLGHQGSLLHQYFVYLGNLVHGNLGISVTSTTRRRSPRCSTRRCPGRSRWSAPRRSSASCSGRCSGSSPAGGAAAGSTRSLPAFTFVQATPYFFLALLAIVLFSSDTGTSSRSAGYALGRHARLQLDVHRQRADHSILPALTIIVTSMAGWMLQMRNVMITTIGEDYVLAAQAKGLSARRIMFTYAARNAILPNIAGFALAIGFVVAGALVMEIVFSYPGVGLPLYNAVTYDDFPVMQGIFLVDLGRRARPPACSPTSSTSSPIRASGRGRPTDGDRRSPLPVATAPPSARGAVPALDAAQGEGRRRRSSPCSSWSRSSGRRSPRTTRARPPTQVSRCRRACASSSRHRRRRRRHPLAAARLDPRDGRARRC